MGKRVNNVCQRKKSKSNKSNLSNLPTELLMKIIGKLKLNKHVHVRLICKRFKNIYDEMVKHEYEKFKKNLTNTTDDIHENLLKSNIEVINCCNPQSLSLT